MISRKHSLMQFVSLPHPITHSSDIASHCWVHARFKSGTLQTLCWAPLLSKLKKKWVSPRPKILKGFYRPWARPFSTGEWPAWLFSSSLRTAITYKHSMKGSWTSIPHKTWLTRKRSFSNVIFSRCAWLELRNWEVHHMVISRVTWVQNWSSGRNA